MPKKKDDLNIWNQTLKEVKDQFRLELEEFDDRKKKVNILLVICSLFITLPLSSSYTMGLIISSSTLNIIIFFVGIILLVISVLLLILSLFVVNLNIPDITEMPEFIGKYPPEKIIKGLVESYIKHMPANQAKQENRRKTMIFAEICITTGVLLTSGSILFSIIRVIL